MALLTGLVLGIALGFFAYTVHVKLDRRKKEAIEAMDEADEALIKEALAAKGED